jgi:hypothetical protein
MDKLINLYVNRYRYREIERGIETYTDIHPCTSYICTYV